MYTDDDDEISHGRVDLVECRVAAERIALHCAIACAAAVGVAVVVEIVGHTDGHRLGVGANGNAGSVGAAIAAIAAAANSRTAHVTRGVAACAQVLGKGAPEVGRRERVDDRIGERVHVAEPGEDGVDDGRADRAEQARGHVVDEERQPADDEHAHHDAERLGRLLLARELGQLVAEAEAALLHLVDGRRGATMLLLVLLQHGLTGGCGRRRARRGLLGAHEHEDVEECHAADVAATAASIAVSSVLVSVVVSAVVVVVVGKRWLDECRRCCRVVVVVVVVGFGVCSELHVAVGESGGELDDRRLLVDSGQ